MSGKTQKRRTSASNEELAALLEQGKRFTLALYLSVVGQVINDSTKVELSLESLARYVQPSSLKRLARNAVVSKFVGALLGEEQLREVERAQATLEGFAADTKVERWFRRELSKGASPYDELARRIIAKLVQRSVSTASKTA
jgi:hypothetical protein